MSIGRTSTSCNPACTKTSWSGWAGTRKTNAFVEFVCFRVERDRCVPEVSHQVHSPTVIPHIHRHDPARTNDPSHFRNRACRLRHKVHGKPRNCGIDACSLEGQRLRVPDPKSRVCAADAGLCAPAYRHLQLYKKRIYTRSRHNPRRLKLLSADDY